MSATTRRGRQSRRKILDTAAELFHRGNVSSTSIDQVLDASGTGKSQFYHYFRSKEDLVREVIRDRLQQLEQGPFAGRMDSFEGIRAWLDVFIEWQKSDNCVGGCPFGSMAAELSDTHPVIREELHNAFDRMQNRLEKGLAVMKRRRELRADAKPRALAAFTFAALQGGVLLAKTSKQVTDLEGVCVHIMDHLRSFAP